MKCPECGFDNAEEAVFCDDCGVDLNSAINQEGETERCALELGQILSERWKISQVVHYDSRCGFYEAEDTQQPDCHMLVVEGQRPLAELEQWVEALKSIASDNIWHPQEIASHEDRLFVLGPWPGEPLRMPQDEVKPRQAALWMRAILVGLENLKKANWQHCAISPDYAWHCGDQAVLVAVPMRSADASAVGATSVIEGFSPPELFGLMGGEVSERSDVYSAGALLYYLLNSGELNIKRLGEGCLGFPNPQLGPDGPLMEVASKALQREPLERFDTVQEMRYFLEEALGEVEPAPAVDTAADEEEAEALSEEGKTRPLPRLDKIIGGSAAASTCNFKGAPVEEAKETSSVSADCSQPDLTMAYEVGRLSNVGAVRKINQDAFVEMRLWACERDVPTAVHFLAVIDGMGGEAEGDKAASIAARASAREVLHSFLELPGEAEDPQKDLPLPERQAQILQRAMKKANSAIFAYASEAPERKGMGCTMSAALICGGMVTVGHVGDTRAYHFDGELRQITRDHSVVGQLVEMGALTREQARHSPKRSIIYRALGTAADIEVETYQRTLKRGDYLFMSSDGVWEYYSDEELQQFFTSGDSPQTICEKLISTCLQRGADDNTTAVAFRYTP
ncbi:MAG: protein phosphatase 2C domain-containing protein [bacterium]|nr:protein phosphatase 2C domain-containing protein [bacterium]